MLPSPVYSRCNAPFLPVPPPAKRKAGRDWRLFGRVCERPNTVFFSVERRVLVHTGLDSRIRWSSKHGESVYTPVRLYGLARLGSEAMSDCTHDCRQGRDCTCAEDICGLCGQTGADKMALWTGNGIYWPGEEIPGTEFVHAECERAETERAHSALTQPQRDAVVRAASGGVWP